MDLPEVITQIISIFIGDNEAKPHSYSFDIKLRRMDKAGREWKLDTEVQLTALQAELAASAEREDGLRNGLKIAQGIIESYEKAYEKALADRA